MKKKVRGSVGVVIAVVLLATATFAVGVGVGMWLSGRDGGLGGEDEAVPADVSVTEEVTETTAETTAALITEIKNAEYIEVTVDGGKYLYSGASFELDGLIAEITKDGKKLNVKIYFSDTATQYAYEELVKKLEENGIEYFENND